MVAITKDIQDIVKLSKQLEKSEIMVQNLSEKLDHFVKAVYSFDDIIGSNVAMQNVIEMAKIASQTDTTVMIQGETGTGKEMIAHAIHKASARSKKPFVSINCSAVPPICWKANFWP